MFLYHRPVRGVWAVLFALTCLTPGCAGKKTGEQSSFSGKVLYRGIFQGRGPVTEMIPEIRDNLTVDLLIADPDTRRAVSEFQESILDALEEMNPRFFDEFKTAIESGDHRVIEDELESAAQRTLHAVSEMVTGKQTFKSMKEDPELSMRVLAEVKQYFADSGIEYSELDRVIVSLSRGEEISGRAGFFFVAAVVAVVAVAVFHWVAVTVNVAVAVNVELALAVHQAVDVVRGDAARSRSARLMKERIIGSIAENLAR